MAWLRLCRCVHWLVEAHLMGRLQTLDSPRLWLWLRGSGSMVDCEVVG
jgi:hypothetical protein